MVQQTKGGGVMSKTWCVYRHTFPDGRMYIGSTGCEPRKRWANGYGYSGQTNVFEAIMMYGWQNIKHEIVADRLTEKLAHDLEKSLIEKTPKEKLYNCELYANGRIKVEKKSEDEFLVGAGMQYNDLERYATYTQIDMFYERLGCSYPFVQFEADHLLISHFKQYDDMLECTQWVAYYPTEGLKRKDFGRWLSEDAEFLKIYHSIDKAPLEMWTNGTTV